MTERQHPTQPTTPAGSEPDRERAWREREERLQEREQRIVQCPGGERFVQRIRGLLR